MNSCWWPCGCATSSSVSSSSSSVSSSSSSVSSSVSTFSPGTCGTNCWESGIVASTYEVTIPDIFPTSSDECDFASGSVTMPYLSTCVWFGTIRDERLAPEFGEGYSLFYHRNGDFRSTGPFFLSGQFQCRYTLEYFFRQAYALTGSDPTTLSYTNICYVTYQLTTPTKPAYSDSLTLSLLSVNNTGCGAASGDWPSSLTLFPS